MSSDESGDIGRHCVYLRGYSQVANQLIGHNSWGIDQMGKVLIFNEEERDICIYEVIVDQIELGQGTLQEKQASSYSAKNFHSNGNYYLSLNRNCVNQVKPDG